MIKPGLKLELELGAWKERRGKLERSACTYHCAVLSIPVDCNSLSADKLEVKIESEKTR